MTLELLPSPKYVSGVSVVASWLGVTGVDAWTAASGLWWCLGASAYNCVSSHFCNPLSAEIFNPSEVVGAMPLLYPGLPPCLRRAT